MKKTLKTNKVLSVYRILSQAKYTKLEDADKIKVWKVARKLAPVATKFEEDTEDAAKKLKPCEDFDAKFQKAQEYERLRQSGQPTIDIMTNAEYKEFIESVLKPYNNLMADAIKEFGEKEVKVEFEPISEDAFGKLLASNEWNMAQTVEIGNLIVE